MKTSEKIYIAFRVMVTFVGIGNASSNPGRGCISLFANALGNRIDPSIQE